MNSARVELGWTIWMRRGYHGAEEEAAFHQGDGNVPGSDHISKAFTGCDVDRPGGKSGGGVAVALFCELHRSNRGSHKKSKYLTWRSEQSSFSSVGWLGAAPAGCARSRAWPLSSRTLSFARSCSRRCRASSAFINNYHSMDHIHPLSTPAYDPY